MYSCMNKICFLIVCLYKKNPAIEISQILRFKKAMEKWGEKRRCVYTLVQDVTDASINTWNIS